MRTRRTRSSPPARTLSSHLPQFLWHFLKPHWTSCIGILLAMVYTALHVSLEPYALKLVIDSVTQSGTDSQIFLTLLPRVLFFLLVASMLIVSWRIRDYLTLKMEPSIQAAIVEELFDHTSSHSYRYFQDNFSGNIAIKIKDVASGIESLIENFREIFRHATTILIASFMLATVKWYLGAFLFCWAFSFVAIIFSLSGWISEYSLRLADSRNSSFGQLVDIVSNIFSVRIFAKKKEEQEFVRKLMNQVAEKDRDLRWAFFKVWSIQGALVIALLTVIIYLMVGLKLQGRVSGGDFAFVIWVSVSMIDQVWGLTETINKAMETRGSCKQSLSLLLIPHEIQDADEAKELEVIQGQIQFIDVCFAHSEREPIFQNKTLLIPSGQKVGLVGYSGSGKSTFVHLIVRLFELTKGQILIDHHDISKVTQDSLRSNIGFIPQDPMLFHRSLRENISYGNPSATLEQVVAAASQANAHEFIMKTSQGYDTWVGERGIKLSGGQRQRIAIARAILKNAPILILDEATSSLDSITESEIQKSLYSAMIGRTTIVIAHRLSTLLKMDRILVFDQGRIVEDGKHENLIQMGGLYAQLWNSQIEGFLPNSGEKNDFQIEN